MKNSLELAIRLIFLTGAMVASGSILRADVALAGEAGAVGSISAQFSATGNNLAATAGAVAVGKSGAFTTARSNPTNLSTVAVSNSIGSLSILGVPVPTFIVTGVNAQNVTYTSLIAESTAQLGVVQGNTFNSGAAPTLNLLPGTTTGVNIP
ncbi:hypothetical protein [Chamaesiphon sp. GL140_3_metabinner_50]|uniref:hypothetical protein n=1 Tax=Chamaesiphon sp. GL140_3_metabinner_50 TaxID=2970812 RepID=UPI0025EE44C1|nr:hypothetical protein [Chamaesiphon sp. GL140_3_metabinner_50]